MALVAVCTPHGGNIPPEYNRAVIVMQGQTPQHTFINVEIDLMVVGKARNVLVEEVLRGTQAEVAWFIDQDVLVPPHSGVLIDQALQYGIISGLYFNRHSPYTPQMYRLSPYPGEEGLYESLVDYPKEGFILADATGAGCLVIRRTVLEAMRDQHKSHTVEARETLLGSLNGRNPFKAQQELQWLLRYAENLSPWFEFLDNKGEDFYFCERARDCGFLTWVNLDVKCEHIGALKIGEGHFQYLKDQGLLVRLGPDGKPLSPTEERIPKPEVLA